jgi:nicotinate-nucleotide adenylyltransferase
MYGKDYIPADDRLAMVRAMCGPDPRLVASSYEIDHQFSGAAIDFVRDWRASRGEELWLVIGSDNANTLHKWVAADELRASARFIVYQRPGHPLDADWVRSPHLVLPPDPDQIEISSTTLRGWMTTSNWTLVKPYLHPSVLTWCQKGRPRNRTILPVLPSGLPTPSAV